MVIAFDRSDLDPAEAPLTPSAHAVLGEDLWELLVERHGFDVDQDAVYRRLQGFMADLAADQGRPILRIR